MKTLYKKRLLKLADFLCIIPRKKFRFDVVVCDFDQLDLMPKEAPRKTFDCSSVGCAIGWCPVVFPRLAYYQLDEAPTHRVQTNKSSHYIEVASELFGLSTYEAYALFSVGQQADFDLLDLGEDATPKQVARNIRQFVRMKTASA